MAQPQDVLKQNLPDGVNQGKRHCFEGGNREWKAAVGEGGEGEAGDDLWEMVAERERKGTEAHRGGDQWGAGVKLC